MLEVTLTIRSPEGLRRVVFEGSSLTIGRGETAGLYIADQNLSRLHASLHRDGDKVWVLDEGSANGTIVNNQPVATGGRPLQAGDKIRLSAETSITVEFKSVSAPVVAAPPGSTAATASSGLRLPVLLALALMAVLILGIGGLALYRLKERRDLARSSEMVTPADDEPAENRETAPREGSASPNAAPLPGQPDSAGGPGSAPDSAVAASGVQRKLYQQMTEAERLDFIDRQAQQISLMMGNRPYAFTEEVLQYIKKYVDGYATRANSSSTRLWGEGLPSLYGRASRYAPHIIRSFNSRGVPPVVGLYLVMIETEYHECLESPVGAKGLFQFMPATARAYGVDPAERCNVEKMAPAAAHYMADRIAEFGPDAMSVALAIAGYNRSPDSVRRDLRDILNSENKERSFWTLIANSDQLDRFFQNENIKYVPKFFAAAIVGETPWAFGLKLNPLSTYTAPVAGP